MKYGISKAIEEAAKTYQAESTRIIGQENEAADNIRQAEEIEQEGLQKTHTGRLASMAFNNMWGEENE